MANPASILVGCGGSGIRTLMRLNALLAEDPNWRHRIARDIYYVLLDTELAMINEFESTVNRQLAGVDKPLMWSLRVAQGHSILQPLVKRHFEDPFKKSADDSQAQRGKKRLFDHWWSHEEFGPFTAPKVKPLTKGAGQCPSVSYFLTWHGLLKVEDVFDRLVRELVGRRSVGGEDPLAELNFCIVAGLAGGTGRGSWQLVAFKVRELMTSKYDRIPTPIAYLFDSSVFENVYRRHPRQEVPMKVNSLTGVSELSVWMKNLRMAGKPIFKYQLPSMDWPADEQMDVLNIDLDLDTSASAPVDNAVLIFGGNRLAVLANNEQYHEMVGTGLYAALSRSSIESQRINERPAYQSLGTATYEVNAVTLRRYFEGLSRIQALRMLAGHNDHAVEVVVDSFIRDCHLRINVTRTNRREFTDDDKGTVMQRACHYLLDLYSEDLGALGGALETDDPKEVEAVVQQLLEPSEERVERAVQRAVEGLEHAPEEVAKKCVVDLFRETRSVANVRRFVEEVARDLEEEIDELPASERMKIDRDNDPLELIKQYKDREYFGWAGPHFNEDEGVDLEEQTRRAVLYANYGAICAELRRRYKAWISIIRRWQDSAEQILATSDKLMAKFKNELKDDIEAAGNTYDDFFDALFSDFDAPEESTPEEFSKGRFYRRDLKPVMKRHGDLELLGEPEFKKELNDVVGQALLNTGLDRDAYDELDKLRRDLESAIRRTVYLPFAFIEQNFSMRKVVENLRQAWLHRFHQMLGQADQLADLISKFSTFFGVRPTRDGDTFTMPSGEEFILEMGASLASTGRPYGRIREDRKTDLARVSLFLPIAEERFDREAAERFIQDRLHRAEVQVEVYTDKQHSAEGSKSNPFIMMAYSIEGVHEVDQISSLDYWQTPTVKSLLMKCEGQDGGSIFDQTADHNGISLTDPLFITHKEVNSARWKPWIDLDASVTIQANETCDALIYALLDPPEELKSKLEEKNWSLPLIGEKKMKWYEFTRRAMFWQEGSPKEDTGCPWKARSSIAQGIQQVYDVLAGTGRQDGNLKTDGPKWADRIRQESRVFWDEILLHLKAPKGSEPYEQLLAGLEQKLDSEAQKCADNDGDREVWSDILSRVKELHQNESL